MRTLILTLNILMHSFAYFSALVVLAVLAADLMHWPL